MAHITITQLNTILSRIVAWVTGKFAAKNATSGKLEYTDMPVVVLASMGSELDGTSTQRPMSPGSTYFLPAEQGVGARIMFVTSDNRPVKISDPVSGVIYCNAYTDLLYRWDAAESEMVPVGGTSSGSIDISGKADLLAGTNMLHPNQWPKAVLRNVTDTMLDDLVSGDVYFDTGRLYLHKGSNQSNVDLGAPNGKTIYLCLADGKLYRWSGSAFTQIAAGGGGSGTVTGVKMNNGSPIAPDSNGVVDLGTVITQHQDISGKVDKVTGKGLSTNDYTDADKNKLVNLPTKYDLEDTLGEKQDTLTFDNAPTAGSNNPVKSGGIKTAIDTVMPTISQNGKWVIGGVESDVDAQGPTGNSILVNENSQSIQGLIVNNVSDGGETDILSAEMGKVLRIAIMQIYNALGTYAFPSGKPVLSWGSTVINHGINANAVTGGLTISNVEIDGVSAGSLPAQIADGKSLSLTLNLPSGNLYVFDDGVTITMGGVNITNETGVWNESTGEINIAAVTDDIVISANAITYVGYGEQNSPLVLMLDGKNQGSEAAKWVDLVNSSRKLSLNGGYTKNSDHITFDGSSAYGIIDDANLDVKYNTGSLEAVYSQASFDNNYHLIAGSFMRYGTALAIMKAAYAPYSSANRRVFIGCFISSADNGTAPSGLVSALLDNSSNQFVYAANEVVLASHCGNNFYLNNEQMSLTDADKANALITSADHNAGDLYVGGNFNGSGNLTGFFPGNIYCVRFYSKVLTATERAQNYKVDKKRFNLQ